MAQERRDEIVRSDDDWEAENLVGHRNGGMVIGDMSYALLAHGNYMLSLPAGAPPRLHLVPHANETARQTGHLVVHSNSMLHVDALLAWLEANLLHAHDRWLTHVVAGNARQLSLTVISRDDKPPSDEHWGRWESLRSSPLLSRLKLRWLVQNLPERVPASLSALNPMSVATAFPLPIGVHAPRALAASFLARSKGLEGRISHRSNLLMCCCMQTALPSRLRAKADLVRNGFACSSQNNSHAADLFLQRAHADHRVVRPSRYRFYSTMLYSKFVASPAGHGRDCYRTWEAFALGAVPVMRIGDHSIADAKKLANLPVVWLDEWKEATPAFLQEHWDKLREARHLDMRRAFFSSWLGQLAAFSAS
eukprot:CAMPEP_0182830548 /NCGR_PEP_ID=MMETSP0006_2-20121128/18635_1 /TAXON_ID=97485 /ORGANISM="Prymnesium parvum, Strain Texoma1" /LENGTH=363 /DNA_ID=CAMNT_0024958125 /DNA_START=314 /DNA_END=1406 /DNA_ORIENTATION=-